MELTKKKTEQLYTVASDRSFCYHRPSIITIDFNLIDCLKKCLEVINGGNIDTFNFEFSNRFECNLYNLKESVINLITNKLVLLVEDYYKIRGRYVEGEEKEWLELNKHVTPADSFLVVSSDKYFHFRFESHLDELGLFIKYETSPIEIEWFLNNFEKGLFESDV